MVSNLPTVLSFWFSSFVDFLCDRFKGEDILHCMAQHLPSVTLSPVSLITCVSLWVTTMVYLLLALICQYFPNKGYLALEALEEGIQWPHLTGHLNFGVTLKAILWQSTTEAVWPPCGLNRSMARCPILCGKGLYLIQNKWLKMPTVFYKEFVQAPSLPLFRAKALKDFDPLYHTHSKLTMETSACWGDSEI